MAKTKKDFRLPAGFKLVEKPQEAEFRKQGRYDEILSYINDLPNDQAFEFPASHIEPLEFKKWLPGLKAAGQYKFKIKVGAIQRHGRIVAFKR